MTSEQSEQPKIQVYFDNHDKEVYKIRYDMYDVEVPIFELWIERYDNLIVITLYTSSFCAYRNFIAENSRDDDIDIRYNTGKNVRIDNIFNLLLHCAITDKIKYDVSENKIYMSLNYFDELKITNITYNISCEFVNDDDPDNLSDDYKSLLRCYDADEYIELTECPECCAYYDYSPDENCEDYNNNKILHFKPINIKDIIFDEIEE